MRVHVDKARRHDLAAGIDFLSPLAVYLAHACDHAAVDGNVHLAGACAAAVENESAAQDDVVSGHGFLPVLGPE